MRIGISINTSWNVYNFRKGLVIDLLKKGNQVYILAPKDEYSVKLEELGCTFIDVPMRNKSYNPVYDFILLLKYIIHLRKLNLDYFLTYTIKPNIYACIASRLTNTRVIANVSGLGTAFVTKSIRATIARKLYQFALKYSHKVFFQNKDDQNLFVSKGLIEEQKTDVLPGSGVDLEFFSSQKASQKNIRFTVIARTLYAKGIIEYIEAAQLIKKSHPNIEFYWVGKSEHEEGLGVNEEQMNSWDNKGIITYVNFTDDVKAIIEDSSCIVLPSYREGTPKSLLEGMAMSKPIVTTQTPGCKDLVIPGENGFLCEAKNASKLADALKSIIRLSNNELVLMGEKSRSFVENQYDQNIVIKKYIQTLQKWR